MKKIASTALTMFCLFGVASSLGGQAPVQEANFICDYWSYRSDFVSVYWEAYHGDPGTLNGTDNVPPGHTQQAHSCHRLPNQAAWWVPPARPPHDHPTGEVYNDRGIFVITIH
jgi:hypothetical protein